MVTKILKAFNIILSKDNKLDIRKSFVNSDIPENIIYFGNPAKFYKKRLDDDTFEKIKNSEYWNKEEKQAKQILNNLDINK
ncbi:MAG: hypothetical protein ABJJ25_12685 [Eudoraea sp.]|uniref:hypothetical protein n=1 Tax=Eudoraea sp. TaxID=1979955 RepID=UPI0032661F53